MSPETQRKIGQIGISIFIVISTLGAILFLAFIDINNFDIWFILRLTAELLIFGFYIYGVTVKKYKYAQVTMWIYIVYMFIMILLFLGLVFAGIVLKWDNIIGGPFIVGLFIRLLIASWLMLQGVEGVRDLTE